MRGRRARRCAGRSSQGRGEPGARPDNQQHGGGGVAARACRSGACRRRPGSRGASPRSGAKAARRPRYRSIRSRARAARARPLCAGKRVRRRMAERQEATARSCARARRLATPRAASRRRRHASPRPVSRTPSSSITVQNGHATASVSAPVSTASRARSTLIGLPCSSIHMCAPPAPQQNVCLPLRFISTGWPTAFDELARLIRTSLWRAR